MHGRPRKFRILPVVVDDVGCASICSGFAAIQVREVLLLGKSYSAKLTSIVERKLDVFNLAKLAEDLAEICFIDILGQTLNDNLRLRRVGRHDVSAGFKKLRTREVFGGRLDATYLCAPGIRRTGASASGSAARTTVVAPIARVASAAVPAVVPSGGKTGTT